MRGDKEYKIYAELMQKAEECFKAGFEDEANAWYNKANDAYDDYVEASSYEEFP